ncbi:MAG: hypothetical protein M9947_19330 [Thermomicrobiales bacterium]|nr:hypothetical protein [Thermomicrobiales bacterium]
MVAAFYSELELAVSKDRLDPFRPASGDQLETAIQYFWNVALCQALYPSLNMLEVVTRNSLHRFLEQQFGRPDWYDDPSFLQRRERDDVVLAKRLVHRTGKPVTPGRIVAALNFGFWVSLLDALYGDDASGPRLWGAFPSPNLALVFPYAPAGFQPYRRRIHGRLDDFRLLRNRVSHYEPIWQGIRLPSRQKRTPPRIVVPQELHAALIETIGWVNPTMGEASGALDMFPLVEQRGQHMIEKRIKREIGIA